MYTTKGAVRKQSSTSVPVRVGIAGSFALAESGQIKQARGQRRVLGFHESKNIFRRVLPAFWIFSWQAQPFGVREGRSILAALRQNVVQYDLVLNRADWRKQSSNLLLRCTSLCLKKTDQLSKSPLLSH